MVDRTSLIIAIAFSGIVSLGLTLWWAGGSDTKLGAWFRDYDKSSRFACCPPQQALVAHLIFFGVPIVLMIIAKTMGAI